MLRGIICPEFRIQQPVEIPTIVTRKSVTVWSRIIDHRKDERVTYHNGIRDFWSFGQSEAQKFSSFQPFFFPETDSSSDVDCQKFVTRIRLNK
jgi:hypothetical protein